MCMRTSQTRFPSARLKAGLTAKGVRQYSSNEIEAGPANHHLVVGNPAATPFCRLQQLVAVINEDIYPAQSFPAPVNSLDEANARIFERHLEPSA